MMNNDMELLRDYAARQSEPAFETLVSRYINLVYATALRQVRDPHLAEEITQAVFIVLARKAGLLNARTVLPAWLHRTAVYAAADVLKMQRRRARREQEALMQSETETVVPGPAWELISPLLDEALVELGEKDRQAVLLHFFQKKTFAEVGGFLGMSEETARKRTNRALEKLRKIFSKRGVHSTTAILASAMSANTAAITAPALLAKSVTAVAVAKGATATGSALALAKAAMQTMLWHNLRTAVFAGAAIVLAGGSMALFTRHSEEPVAKISYKSLEEAWRFEQSINPTNLTFHFLIVPGKKGVQPKDLHLTIQSASRGDIPVHLGSRGQMLDFPSDDDLRRENPFVVSDQPKGSLAYGYWVYVPRPEGVRFRYDHLANAVDEANKAALRASQMAKEDALKETDSAPFPMFPPVINGIFLHFPQARAGKANVTIATSEGPKNYVADAHGVIKLKINPRLKAENPELIFSERPDWIGITVL